MVGRLSTRCRSTLAAAAFAGHIAGAHASGQASGTMDELANLVDSTRSEWNIPGLSVAVVKDGEVVLAKGFGMRDVERALPATARTIFPLGSTTKSFTAFAVAIAAEDGNLDLDKPLGHVVPEFQMFDEQASARATIRDFLAHRSGLPGQYDMLWLLTPMSREELFSRLSLLEPNAPLGTRFQYSNVGYAVAATALERLTGMSWEEFLKARIFRPLDMSRTGYVDTSPDTTEDRAQPYRASEGTAVRVAFSGSVTFENVALIAPAGGVSSTAEDMAKWLLLHLQGGEFRGTRLISKQALDELFTPQMEIEDQGYRTVTQAEAYGLGWAISDYRGHRVVNHGGNIEGFSSLVSLIPDIGAGVAVLSNTMNLAGYDISRQVYDRLLELPPLEDGESMRGVYARLEAARAEALRVPQPDPEAPPLPDPGSCAGDYYHPVFGTARVSVAGGLRLEFESGVVAQLFPLESHSFKGTTSELYLPGFELRFSASDTGTVDGFSLVLQPGVPEIRFVRR